MELREETWLCKGTPLYHEVYGNCRVKWAWPDKFCFIIDRENQKPVGALGDAYGRIVDGRCLEWTNDTEIRVLSDKTIV